MKKSIKENRKITKLKLLINNKHSLSDDYLEEEQLFCLRRSSLAYEKVADHHIRLCLILVVVAHLVNILAQPKIKIDKSFFMTLFVTLSKLFYLTKNNLRIIRSTKFKIYTHLVLSQ